MTTRMIFVGRTLTATLALGVTLAVGGCGNQGTGPGYASSDSNSSGVSYAAKALTKDEIMRVTYAAAKKAGSAHMTMATTGKAKLNAQGDVDYGHGQPSMTMTMSMPQMGQIGKGPMAMRYVDKILYMQIPGLTPPGKFIAIDPSDKTSPLAKSFSSMTGEMDPMKSIVGMQSAIRSAQRVGKQTMDGATVEHYKLTVDTAALLKSFAPTAAQPPGMPKTVTYDLWLDEQHLLRRTSFDLMDTHFEANMSKWGEPVHVQRPSAAQIVKGPQI
jgi:hypothetical protein